MNINIITPFSKDTFLRQLPPYLIDKGFVFFENSNLDLVWDLVVVYEGINENKEFKCKKGGLVFISGEPPMSRKYSTIFLKQFDHVISSHPGIIHPNNHLSQQALPWHFGLSYKSKKFNYSFDDLLKMPLPEKTKNISIITSNKKMMPGHKQRMIFLEAVKTQFGDRIDYFGQGIKPIDDKADALLPYKFAICIENSSIKDYWTEKIADSFLAYTIPIYHGCTNINSYFDSNALVQIDINNVEESLSKLQYLLDHADEIYIQKKSVLSVEREKILNQFNLFTVLCENFNDFSEIKTLDVILRPSESFFDHMIKMNFLRLKRLVLRYTS